MAEGIEKTIQGAIDSLKNLPTERRTNEHRHCRWCGRTMNHEYNKRFCSEHCRSFHTISLTALLAFCIGTAAYFLAIVGL